MKVTNEMIEIHARADAEFCGKSFDGMSKADRTRFRARSKWCLEAVFPVVTSGKVCEHTGLPCSATERYPETNCCVPF